MEAHRVAERATDRDTMRAITRDRYGRPEDVLQLARVARPVAARDEVLVRVHAAGIAIGDWLSMEGLPYIARPSYGLFRPKQRIPGMEMSGRVEAVGADVTAYRPGDEVFGFATGAFADYVAAAPDDVVPKPGHLSFAQAAALPVSALAAYQALTGPGDLKSGQSVLVVGASGAVGTFAVQIAKALGAEVTGVAGTRNVELVASLGAHQVIDYTKAEIGDGGTRYDLIIDLAGNRSLTTLRRALRTDGTAVLVGSSGGRFLMGSGRTIRAMLVSPLVRQRLRPMFSSPNAADLAAVAGLAASGSITPVIDSSHPLEATAEAMQRIGQRHSNGKSVVTL